MPQMGPLKWFFFLFFFNLIYLLLVVLLVYLITNEPTIASNPSYFMDYSYEEFMMYVMEW